MLKENADNLKIFSKTNFLNDDQREAFAKYVELIEKWNKRTNIVSKSDAVKIIDKHIVESLYFYDDEFFAKNTVLMDIGSGGGFPGIPLKIIAPTLQVSLVDSKRIKALFLKEVVEILGLEDVDVVCERAENLATSYSNKVDIVTARAVTKLKDLWDISSPVLKKGGCLISLKGGEITKEIESVYQKQNNFDIIVKEVEETSLSLNVLKKIILTKN